jgi:acyl carrier protein
VPVGVAGELYIGGLGVARGYLNRPDLTAEKFIPDLFSAEPGARLYRTGDLARRRSDGTLECLGRADQQVKLRGYRIEVEEIAAVLGQHPWVADAAVALQGAGTAEARLVGYLVAQATHPVTADVAGSTLQSEEAQTLRQWLREHLPEYMVPAMLVWLPDLPRTPNGKLDRKALPVVTPATAEAGQTEPRTTLEAVITALWAEVLGVERVGIHDDFFALGGHSLMATRIIAWVYQVFKADLPLRSIFEAPTVAQLAAVVLANEPKPGYAMKVAEHLSRIKRMSSDELATTLAQRR